MESSYQYFKRIGVKEINYKDLPDNYKWITGCGGDGYYWNFFADDSTYNPGSDSPKGLFMCKIRNI